MADDYQLVDFGKGRKLERFGDLLLDRPAPAADSFAKRDPAAWSQANARFEILDGQGEVRGRWMPRGGLPDHWTFNCGDFQLELKPTPFGHLGVFPEQRENWRWLSEQVRRCDSPRVLNLFAYTGAATLAVASAGAQVVHVDAARNTVDWSRRNAELSRLAEAPIRWIVEDALRFAHRECKRGNRYDAVILDPPSFGRGPKREIWKLERDLPELLALCGELTNRRPKFLLLTCHTLGYDANALRTLLAEHVLADSSDRALSHSLGLRDPAGRNLHSGFAVRLSDLSNSQF